jgi:hypothetical protein
MTALAGVLLILGVVALNAHAALPQHHHEHGVATMCLASASVAVLAGGLLLAARRPAAALPVLLLPRSWPLAVRFSAPLAAPVPSCRAGPIGPFLLRR